MDNGNELNGYWTGEYSANFGTDSEPDYRYFEFNVQIQVSDEDLLQGAIEILPERVIVNFIDGSYGGHSVTFTVDFKSVDDFKICVIPIPVLGRVSFKGKTLLGDNSTLLGDWVLLDSNGNPHIVEQGEWYLEKASENRNSIRI